MHVSVIVVILWAHECLRQCIPKQSFVVEVSIIVRDVDAFHTTCRPNVGTMYLSCSDQPTMALQSFLQRLWKDYHICAYLWSNLSQEDMNRPTNHVIAPGLVKVPERLLRKCGNAGSEAIILRIRANTTLLDCAAKPLYGGRLGFNGGNVVSGRDSGPRAEVGNPGIIFQHCAILIKSPIGELEVNLLALTSSQAFTERHQTV